MLIVYISPCLLFSYLKPFFFFRRLRTYFKYLFFRGVRTVAVPDCGIVSTSTKTMFKPSCPFQRYKRRFSSGHANSKDVYAMMLILKMQKATFKQSYPFGTTLGCHAHFKGTNRRTYGHAYFKGTKKKLMWSMSYLFQRYQKTLIGSCQFQR